jgi:hypothetical protein
MKTTYFLPAATLLLAALVPVCAAPVEEIVVEALVDGDSTFHVRPETVWWESGEVFKPGKWSGQDQPTFINGIAWTPRWRDDKNAKGRDKTASYSITLKSTELTFELLSVTDQRGGTGIEQRSAVTAKQEGGHFVVRIPDPENGARWYKFAIRKKS